MVPARSIRQIGWEALATSMAYLVACGLAVALTRFGGGVACLWVANAVLLAVLISSRRRRWPFLAAACWCTGVVAAGLWGLGWQAAAPMATINVAEPVIAAVLARRWGVHRSGLNSARQLALFTVAAGVVAPALTGIAGASLVAWITATELIDNLGRWYAGHALGALTFTPVFAQIASGELSRWWRRSTGGELLEAAALISLVAVVAMAVFAQSELPLLFLPALPLMLITFRVGRVGSAAAVVVLAAVGIVLTADGNGPVNLLNAGMGERLLFLQVYLAATVFTVLPVAADLTRRQSLFAQLRDSEARFRLLTENSTDIVMNLDVEGIIRYVSPSIERLGGYDPKELVGRSAAMLIDPEDRNRVRAVHLRALEHPDDTFTVEYRGLAPGGDRWFETHTRAVIDSSGTVCGVVSAVRETSVRRRAETELSHAANTDPLTGLYNRRLFDRELARRLSGGIDGRRGSVALFDLDHFKHINDNFGHQIGDEVLRAFARLAGAKVRSSDVLARVGGEEFGLICSTLCIEDMRAMCDRIRQALADHTIKAGDWPVRATLSVGIAPFGPGDDPVDVLRAADTALYCAKEDGRNRLSLAFSAA